MGNAHRKRSPAGVKAGSSWPWSRAGKQRAGRSLGGDPGGLVLSPSWGCAGEVCCLHLLSCRGGLGKELSPVSGQVAGGFVVP